MSLAPTEEVEPPGSTQNLGDSSGKLARQLENARRELLDLSSKNRLISTPRGPRNSSVEIFDERTEEIYRLLVREKRVMSFLPDDAVGKESNESSDQPRLAQPEESEPGSPPSERHLDAKLQTRLSSDASSPAS